MVLLDASLWGFPGTLNWMWKPWDRPRTCWRDYIYHMAWECLGIPQEELEDVAEEKDIWAALRSMVALTQSG